MALIIDERLLEPNGEVEITENFNRVMGYVDNVGGSAEAQEVKSFFAEAPEEFFIDGAPVYLKDALTTQWVFDADCLVYDAKYVNYFAGLASYYSAHMEDCKVPYDDTHIISLTLVEFITTAMAETLATEDNDDTVYYIDSCPTINAVEVRGYVKSIGMPVWSDKLWMDDKALMIMRDGLNQPTALVPIDEVAMALAYTVGINEDAAAEFKSALGIGNGSSEADEIAAFYENLTDAEKEIFCPDGEPIYLSELNEVGDLSGSGYETYFAKINTMYQASMSNDIPGVKVPYDENHMFAVQNITFRNDAHMHLSYIIGNILGEDIPQTLILPGNHTRLLIYDCDKIPMAYEISQFIELIANALSDDSNTKDFLLYALGLS